MQLFWHWWSVICGTPIATICELLSVHSLANYTFYSFNWMYFCGMYYEYKVYSHNCPAESTVIMCRWAVSSNKLHTFLLNSICILVWFIASCVMQCRHKALLIKMNRLKVTATDDPPFFPFFSSLCHFHKPQLSGRFNNEYIAKWAHLIEDVFLRE
jgi:hypothetical protein